MQNLPRISKQLQPMQRIPTKKPTVQKPCIDRADLEFSGLHNKKERKTLRFDVQNSGAPPGTRTLVPLIKINQRATIVNFQNCVNLLFLSFCRKFVFCICCILCTCCPLSHPLSSRSGVQKVCRAKIIPLKQASVFMQSRENGRVRTQNGSCNLACLAQTSNVHQQLRFMAGIWTTAISYKSKAALSMWTFLD